MSAWGHFRRLAGVGFALSALLLTSGSGADASGPTLPANSISYGFDDAGRLTTVIDPTAPSNGVATYAYDNAGNITQINRLSSSGVSVVQVAPAKAAVGVSVTVYGTGFSATASQDSVSFGGQAATPTFATTTQLQVTVPAGATSGPVTVTAPGGNASGGSLTVVPAPQAPTITNLSTSLTDQSSTLTITGTNFSTTADDDNVAIAGIRARVTAATATSLTVTVPPAAMSGKVSVETPAGVATSGSDVFVAPRGTPSANVQTTARMAIGDTNRVISLPTTSKPGLVVFDGTAGQYVFLNIPSSSISAASISIYDPFGLNITGGSFGTSGGSVDTFKLPTSGTYTIVITPAVGSGNVTLSLLDATPITGTITADGTPKTISGITAGVNASETFTGSTGQRVFLKIDSQLSSVIVRLRDPNGILLASATVGAASSWIDTQTLQSNGTYTIQVDPTGSVTGSITLTLYTVPADISGTITPGNGTQTPTAFTIGTPGQGAAYTFTGTLNQRISIQLQPPTSGSSIPSGYVRLIKPDGTELINSGIFSNSAAYIDTQTLPVAGTWTVVVDPYGAGIGSGRLSVYAVPADISGTVTPGGTGQTPKAPVFNTPGQNASYTFTGSVNQRVSVKVTPPASGSTLQILNLSLVDPNGTTLSNQLVTLPTSGSYGFIDTQTLALAGTYTIKIDPYQADTGGVRLYTYSVPADISGTITVGGASKTPSITVPGQNAKYTFSGTASETVKVALSGSTITQGTVRFLNPDGSVRASTGFGTSATSLQATLGAAGTYSVQVDPTAIYIGSVTLTLTKVGAAIVNPGSPPTTFEKKKPAALTLPPRPHAPRLHLPHFKPSSTERWIPPNGDPSTWFSRRPQSPYELVPDRSAASGVTAIAGRVLRLDGLPLPGVSVRGGGASDTTDRAGRFLLKGVQPGHVVLTVDASTADRHGASYGTYEMGVNTVRGKTTALPYSVWSPLLDTNHEVQLHYPLRHAITVTTPEIPGLEVHIPAGSEIRDRQGHLIDHIGITPVPLDRSPYPMPGNFPVYFTIQPGGTYVWPHGVAIVYPNKFHARPGQRVEFYSYDPRGQGWHVYGEGTVTPNGKQIKFDPGTRQYELTSSGVSLGCIPCFLAIGALAGWFAGDPVDVPTGTFSFAHTDLVEPGTPQIDVTRSYASNDTNTRTFGIGDSSPYGMFLYNPGIHDYSFADLVFANDTRIHYIRISPGTDYAEAILENDATPGPFYKSRITWNGTGWDLTTKDGTVYTFGNGAPLQSVRDRFGNQVTILHGTSTYGDISDVLSSSGRWLRFTYNGVSGRASEVDDQSGRSVKYQYDGSGHLLTYTDPRNHDTTFGYDAQGRMATVEDPRLNTFITNHYDSNSRVDVQTLGDTGTYHYNYTTDGNNNVTAADIQNPRGNTEHVTFNSTGQPLSDTLAQGTSNADTTTYTYQSGTNLLLHKVDQLSRETDYTYDGMGNILSVTRLAGTPSAVTTNYTYDPTFSQVTSVTDPLSHSIQFGHNSRGALTTVTNALNKTVSTVTPNVAGQPTSEKDALQNQTTYTYFLADPRTITDPNGATTTKFYDSQGSLTHVIDPYGRDTSATYDSFGRKLTWTDPAGQTTSYQYDSDENLSQLTDPRQHATTFGYDAMDRLASIADPLQHTTSFAYDSAGNLVSMTDRRGLVTTYQYDELNRPSFVGYDTTGTPPNQQYGSTTSFVYDGGDRLHQVTDSQAGQITLNYDGLNELTSEVTPEGTVSYTYDSASRRQTMNVSGQAQTTYGYDNANRPTSVVRGSLSGGINYNDAGNPTIITLPDGVTETFSYDGDGNVTGVTYALGQTTLGTLIYAYDAADRQIGVGGNYARTSLPTTSSATYDVANRIATWGGQSYSWNNDGELTGDGVNTYTWNARDQLSGISGGTTASYTYDGLARRESTTLAGTTTRYLYDGQRIAQEQSGSGADLRDYLANPFNGQLYGVTAGATTQSFLTDALGSTVALADASGNIQTAYTYDPFGVSSTASGTSYQFTGRPNDGNGLQYNRARYYAPALGRFISEDAPQNASWVGTLYAYANSDPRDLVDPNGTTGIAVGAGGEGIDLGGAAAAAGPAAGAAGVGFGFGFGLKQAANSIPPLSNLINMVTGGGGGGGPTNGENGGNDNPNEQGCSGTVIRGVCWPQHALEEAEAAGVDPEVSTEYVRGGTTYREQQYGGETQRRYELPDGQTIITNGDGTRVITIFWK
jgi:RHS repeat-associated protein